MDYDSFVLIDIKYRTGRIIQLLHAYRNSINRQYYELPVLPIEKFSGNAKQIALRMFSLSFAN